MASDRERPGRTVESVCSVLSSAFADAIEKDLYPEQAMESLFGVEEAPVGRVVYGAWKTLFIHNVASAGAIGIAMSSGTLPAFFEGCVRGLAHHSHYTARLVGQDVPMPWSCMRDLPAGALFTHIKWDTQLLAILASTEEGGV